MKKIDLSINRGSLVWDKEKEVFKGYIFGEYCQMKKGTDNKWYVYSWTRATLFESKPKEQDAQLVENKAQF